MQLSSVKPQRTPHIVLFLIMTLFCLLSPAAAQTKKAAAQPKTPLDRDQVLKLMQSISPEAVAAQIKSRGLEFEPEVEDISWLIEQVKEPPSKWAAVINELKTLVPAALAPDQAQPQIEQILTTLSQAQPTSLEILEVLHPQLMEDKGKVMSVFDPQRYRKHTVGKARGLQGSSRVAAALFVFTVDGIEKLHFAQFTPTKAGKLLLRDIIESSAERATFHLGAELDLVETRLREIYRSDFDNAPKVAENVMTPALIKSLAEIGGWKRIVRGQRVAQESLRIEPMATIDMKSIRPVLKVSHPAGERTVEYFADFERIGDDLRIVRLRDKTGGRDIAGDPELDLYLCRRYESSGCDPYRPNPTELYEFAPVARLQSMAEAAMQDFQGGRLKEIAEEMRVSVVGDDDPLGLSYLATATFLEMKYPEAEQMALQAVAKGATVYFPVLHFFIPGFGDPWFGRAMLGISKNGLEYVPSADINEYARYTVPWSDVDKTQVAPKLGVKFLSKPHPLPWISGCHSQGERPHEDGQGKLEFRHLPFGLRRGRDAGAR